MKSGAFWWLLQASFVSIIMFPVYTLLYCVHVEMSVDLSRQIILFSLTKRTGVKSLQRVSFSV